MNFVKGGVCVGRSAPLEPTTRLDILDSAGGWRGCLAVDETLGTLQDVRDDHALFLHTDSLGEQSLRLIQFGEIPSPSG